jgi:hypothetical protein
MPDTSEQKRPSTLALSLVFLVGVLFFAIFFEFEFFREYVSASSVIGWDS